MKEIGGGGGAGVGRGWGAVREREGNGGKRKRADDAAQRLQGTYHAFASEKLSGIHVHDADVGSRHVACRYSVLVN